MKWKYRLGVVAGNALEFYDIAVFAAISGYLTTAFAQQGINQASYIVWGIFALRFLVRPIGGYLIGRYADRSGRKSALILTSILTGIATFAMALLPVNMLGLYAPLAFLLLQMIQALSFGGEYPTLITYLLSDQQDKNRSKTSSLIVGSAIVGVLFSLLIVLILEKSLSSEVMQNIGWRIPLLFGLFNILVSFWFRAKLPEQPILPKKEQHIDPKLVTKIFLISVPGAVVFYAQNLASSLLRDMLQLGALKSYYALFFSGLLLIALLVCGFLTDRFSTPRRVFHIGIIGITVLAAILYVGLGNQNLLWVLSSQILLTAIVAMILSNLAAVLAEEVKGKTVTLGLGYNIALSIFGGFSPLIIGALTPYGLMFTGLYVASSGLTVLLTNRYFIAQKYAKSGYFQEH